MASNPIVQAVLDRLQAFPSTKLENYVAVGLFALGFYSVARFLVSYFKLVGKFFLAPKTNLYKFGPKGSWVVVTGASDGIGKEYATQFAQRGFNVVLVSRTQSKLEALAQEIESKFTGIKTKVYAMDFAKNNDKDFEGLKAVVAGLDVAILVNNVGMSHEMPVPFVETPKAEMEDIININCHGTLKVTNIVLPGMIERKRGLIMTMGSFGGLFPTPLLATYSGSKAFLQHWSVALGEEVARYNIKTELVLSHLVTSAMSKIRRPSAMVPTPRAFVKTAIASIGQHRGDGRPYTNTPYPMHALMQWWVANTVGIMGKIALVQNLKMHVDIRKRALRKKEREAKKQ